MSNWTLSLFLAVVLLPGWTLAADGRGEEIPGWGVLHDPVGDCPVDPVDSGITLTIPAGIHDMSPRKGTANAPRIWQPVEGNFLYEVRVDTFPLPDAKSGANGNTSYIAAGILVWHDDDNFLRWTRSANGESARVFLSCEHYQDGKLVGGGIYPIEDHAIYLRVERRGDHLYFSARRDAANWRGFLKRPFSEETHAKLGVVGINVTQQNATFALDKSYLLSAKQAAE